MSATAPRPATREAPAKIAAGGVKKARNEGLKVVTANDLLSGAVVYWTKGGAWTNDLSAAFLVEGQAALAELARASADEGRAVGPYLMDVTADRAPSGRARLRETIRKSGPTIHPEFGRQAERIAR